jgi:hypothetical protein
MRKLLAAVFSTLLTLGWPSSASAQPQGAPMPVGPRPAAPAPAAQPAPEEQQQDDQQEARPGSETEGQAVEQGHPERQNGKVRMAPNGANPEAPGEVHTVVKGDTLWDLSQKYLGSPWYWPKVWSYNPQIANPHWIYPGNQVRFFPEGEQGPSRIEVGENAAEPVAESAEQGAAPMSEENEDVVPSTELEGEDNTVHQSGKGYSPKAAGIRYVQMGFVTNDEVSASGVIKASFAESIFLTQFDVAYIDFKDKGSVRVGEKYLIFHKERAITHPVTKQRVGYVTKLLGVVKVESTSESHLVRARVIELWDSVERGDLIGPYGEHVRREVSAKPNERELTGYVVSGLVASFDLIGEHAVIVVDRGSNDGVQQGNTFTVTRRGDPSSALLDPAPDASPDFPVEDIGSCIALEVKATASTCLMTRSLREVIPGDHIVMRAGGAKVGALTK